MITYLTKRHSRIQAKRHGHSIHVCTKVH